MYKVLLFEAGKYKKDGEILAVPVTRLCRRGDNPRANKIAAQARDQHIIQSTNGYEVLIPIAALNGCVAYEVLMFAGTTWKYVRCVIQTPDGVFHPCTAQELTASLKAWAAQYPQQPAPPLPEEDNFKPG